MNINKRLSTITGMLTAIIVFALDQWSKHYMVDILDLLNRPAIEITSFFNLVAVWNQGVSFGMFASHNQPALLIGLSSIITIILFVWLMRNESRFAAIALGLVIGGATGNICDRLKFGKVFDFLDFHVAGFHWPAFNVADMGVVIGVVLLCIHSMFFDKPKLSEGKNS